MSAPSRAASPTSHDAITTTLRGAMSQHGMRPFALAPADGTTVENPTGGVTTFKATSDQSSGGLTVIEGVSAPGEGPPLHVHREQDEFIYTLDGTFRVRLGDDLIEALPGSFVFIPRNTPHTWQNIGDGSARFIATLSPASVEFEEFFLRYADLPPAERGPEAFGRLAAEMGAMEVSGPPLAQSHPSDRLLAVTRWTPSRPGSIMAGAAIPPNEGTAKRVEAAHRYDVPAERGFAFITDTANWPTYWPGFVRLDEGSVWGAVGDTSRLTTRLLGRKRELTMTVTAFEPNRLVTYTSTQPGLPDARHERHFEPHGDGFVYRLVVEYEQRGGVAGLFDRLLLDRGIRHTFQRTFAALEREFEVSAQGL